MPDCWISGAGMDECSYEARKSAPKERVEVTMRPECRRRWSSEEKLRIVRETLRPGAVASVVASVAIGSAPRSIAVLSRCCTFILYCLRLGGDPFRGARKHYGHHSSKRMNAFHSKCHRCCKCVAQCYTVFACLPPFPTDPIGGVKGHGPNKGHSGIWPSYRPDASNKSTITI